MKDLDLWIERANRDLETADFNREHGKYFYSAFLYQQAVEKALKYALLKKDKDLPKIHDCFVLAKKAGVPEEILEKADLVTPYYFRTRYPDAGDEEVTGDEINEVKKAADEVLKWIRKNF